ncbi:hypothetical protein [Desulforamulus ruminis]|uniref:Uncharacterized protein n=1 Tax=Desulforamulus ruminis (strain ATCC 23193 / DSM 2154 / NCIMB 8452 / DL) TaxID=696281 RepID=F6DNK3_DESRL|nr:hypothetical protein [Desulforamulus ruminis]AEG58543.1 hypothetical protein Desru_0245 [Desulforamulus ruminis DSM 2154]
MATCPHAKGANGCNALLNYGFSSNTLIISDSWWHKFCASGKHKQCPNMKAALNMKEEKERKAAAGTFIRRDSSGTAGKMLKPKRKGLNEKANAVHAHGGKAPHFCEKPWRAAEIRFRVTNSKFYTRPWVS